MSDPTLPPPNSPTPPTPSVGAGEPHPATGVIGVDDTAATPMRNVGSEFVATVLLMLAGPGLIVLAAGQVDRLAVAASFGAAVAIAIGVIGAVANPVLSLALRITNDVTTRELIEDWIGQFAGGIVGAALIWGINDQTRSGLGATGWDVGGYSELGSVIAAELVFTTAVVAVFLSALRSQTSTTAIALYTGLVSTIGYLVLLGISGGGMNPARSLGSALFTDTDPNALGQVAVFIVVPMLAAFAGVFVWLAIDDAEVDDTVFDNTIIDRAADRLDGTPD